LNFANRAYFAAFFEKLDKLCSGHHAITTHSWIRFSSNFDCEKSCHFKRQKKLILKVFVVKIFTLLEFEGFKVREFIFILKFWLALSFKIIA